MRDRALFDLVIDSKLCGCDVVKVRIGDLVLGGLIRSRAIVVQAKTGRPVQFELMTDARASLLARERRGGTLADYVFPSRFDHADHLRHPAVRPTRRRMDRRHWPSPSPRGVWHPLVTPHLSRPTSTTTCASHSKLEHSLTEAGAGRHVLNGHLNRGKTWPRVCCGPYRSMSTANRQVAIFRAGLAANE